MLALVCGMPSMLVAQGAGGAADSGKMVQIFSAPIKTEGGEFTVVILNDRTIEALFGTSPAKAALRVRARMATILYIQGVAGKEFEFKPDVTAVQKGETLEGKPSNMTNFVAGKVAKGAKVQGMVEFPKKLNLYDPFKITMNGQTAEFQLNGDDVRDFGNK